MTQGITIVGEIDPDTMILEDLTTFENRMREECTLDDEVPLVDENDFPMFSTLCDPTSDDQLPTAIQICNDLAMDLAFITWS